MTSYCCAVLSAVLPLNDPEDTISDSPNRMKKIAVSNNWCFFIIKLDYENVRYHKKVADTFVKT